MKSLILFFSGLLSCLSLFSQNGDWILNHDVYHYVDRLDVLGYSQKSLPTALKPYGRDAVASWVIKADQSRMSSQEKKWNEVVRLQVSDSLAALNSGKGLFNFLGKNKRDVFSVDQPGFRMYVNPVLYLTGGLDRNNDPAAANSQLPLYNNQRGLVIRGSLGNRVGFHTEVSDYLTRIPEFRYRDFRSTGTIPGEENVKQFGDQNGVNYFKTRGYLTVKAADWLRIKVGKDRVHWGNGWQSLFLSDHSADALMLNLHAKFWKLEYMSHFAQFIDYFPGKSDVTGDFPRKYGAFHTLLFRPIPQLTVGVFEALMYGQNQPYGRRGFELQYLNPVIFYRSAEQLIGSPDNAMIGASVKANLFNTIQIYGQGAIDDFNFGNRVNGPGYWGNQWAVQGGVKYYNAFTVPTLDLQLEYNRVKPYVYQHYSVVTNFSNYGSSLGHAAGANVEDVHMIIRYHPLPAWNLQLVGSLMSQGLNQDGDNYGWDINSTYNRRPYEYGHTVGQGLSWSVQQLWGRLSWQLGSSDAYLEMEGRYRREQTGSGNYVQSASGMVGLRLAAAPEQVRR